MTNLNNDRVLCRRGARELTQAEAEEVSAGQAHTNVCSLAVNYVTLVHTGGDGDACSDSHPDL
jgi:hypothetical protein